MTKQDASNNLRFYAPHHFVFYPMVLILIGCAVFLSYRYPEEQLIWLFVAVLVGLITWVSFMLRQHYALTLQDRIIRLEMRYRYFALTGKRLESVESQLSDSQLFALRFAPDEELPLLVEKTLAEKLSGRKIKKSIVNWQPDNHRV